MVPPGQISLDTMWWVTWLKGHVFEDAEHRLEASEIGPATRQHEAGMQELAKEFLYIFERVYLQ
jgi:hypothetical protein